MKFIQDKLSELRPIMATTTFRDMYGNVSTGRNYFSAMTPGQVVADPASCRISYRDVFVPDFPGKPSDHSFVLKDVQKIVVENGQTWFNRGAASEILQLDPQLFTLRVVGPNQTENPFFFEDEKLANRVAKAMVHAVELCGGGSKPEPF